MTEEKEKAFERQIRMLHINTLIHGLVILGILVGLLTKSG